MDFLIEGKTVIECDGEFHIDFSRYEVSFETAFRNILLLYQGYSVIVIDIYDMS